jgi:hypothetical protein
VSAQPPSGPPRAPGAGPSIGPPGGVFGPPGGLLPPVAPFAAGLGAMAAPPMPLAAPASARPEAVLPGGGPPLGMPDLQAVGRAAMAEVLEGQRAALAARDRLPDLIDVADRTRTQAQAAGAAPAVGGLPPPPPPPPGSGHAPPPPPPARQRVDRSTWPGAQVVPRERDRAQRIADAAYPLYQRLTDNKLGVVIAIALFGLIVPILVLRQSWDVRWRIVLSLLVTYIWVSIAANLF